MIGRLLNRAFILVSLAAGTVFVVSAQGHDITTLWATATSLQRCVAIGVGLVAATVVIFGEWRWTGDGGWAGDDWSTHDGWSSDGDCGGDGGD